MFEGITAEEIKNGESMIGNLRNGETINSAASITYG